MGKKSKKAKKGTMVCGSEDILIESLKGLGKLNVNLFNASYVTDKDFENFDGPLICGKQKVSIVSFNLLLLEITSGNLPFAQFKEDISCFVAIVDKKTLKKKVNFFLGIEVPLVICCEESIPKQVKKRLQMADVPVVVSKDGLTPNGIQECIALAQKNSKGYFRVKSKLIFKRKK